MANDADCHSQVDEVHGDRCQEIINGPVQETEEAVLPVPKLNEREHVWYLVIAPLRDRALPLSLKA